MSNCAQLTAKEVQEFLSELKIHPVPKYEIVVDVFSAPGSSSHYFYAVKNITGKTLFQTTSLIAAKEWIKQKEKQP